MKAGDTVELIDGPLIYNQRAIPAGTRFVIEAIHRSYSPHHSDMAEFEKHPEYGHIGKWFVTRFKVVEPETLMTITGTLEGDELVVPGGHRIKLPKALVPEDPELTELREQIARILEKANKPMSARLFRAGNFDKVLKEELSNVQA